MVGCASQTCDRDQTTHVTIHMSPIVPYVKETDTNVTSLGTVMPAHALQD